MQKWLAFVCIVIPVVSYASIYTWTDSNGTIHYSDSPAPNAKIVQLTPEQFSQASAPAASTPPAATAARSIPAAIPAAANPPAAVTPNTASSSTGSFLGALSNRLLHEEPKTQTAPPLLAVPGYSEIHIGSPIDQATIRDNQGEVEVQVTLNPALQTDDQLVYLLDNAIVDKPTTATTVKLVNIDRGEHKLQVQVQNKNNKVLLSSNNITFYMQRPRVASK